MRTILFLLFVILGAGAAYGQFPANPNKIRLGFQTSADGLVYRTDSIPDWTPADRNSAWIAFDTVAGVLYYYEGGTWNSFTSGGGGGAGIDSIAYASDTLYIYTPAETFKAEIISGGVTGSGTTNTVAKFTGATAIGNSLITDDGTNVAVGGTSAFQLPNGTTAQRPVTPSSGMARYNTSNGQYEGYGVSAWLQKSFPIGAASQTIRHDGTNWVSNGLLTNDNTTVSINPTSNTAAFVINRSGIPVLSFSTITGGGVTSQLMLEGNGISANRGLAVRNYANSSTAGPQIQFFRGRGTYAVPAAISLNDEIGAFRFRPLINASTMEFATANSQFGAVVTDTSYNKFSSTYFMSQSTSWTNKPQFIAHHTGNVGIGDFGLINALTAPQRTLHVNGEVRITDLTTDPPTKIIGADADGDLSALTLGEGVTIDAGVLNVAGGAGIDSIAYASDTLYIYTPSETFKAEIISSSGAVDSLTYTATTQALGIIGSNTVSLLMNTDGTLLGSNTDAQKLRVDTAGTIASKVFLAGQLASYLAADDLLPTWTTAGRPGTPAAGRAGYNTDNGNIDFYGPSAWENPLRSATATGLGTARRVLYADANGRAATGSISYNGTTELSITNAGNTTIELKNTVSNGYVFFRGTDAEGKVGQFLVTGAGYSAIPNALIFSTSLGKDIIFQPDGHTASAGGSLIKFFIGGFGSSQEFMRIQPSPRRMGIETTSPQRTLHVTGEVRITDLTTDPPTRVVGADADGDLGAWSMATLADSLETYISPTVADGSITSAKLANGAAGGAKLGGLTYISADDIDVNLSSFLTLDWLSNYSQLVVWLRIGNTASRTVTFPTPSSSYAGKVVEIFFGATDGGAYFGQISSATNRITYRDGTNVATTTSYDGGQTLKYLRVICAQDPNTLAYQWLILDSRN